MKKTLKIILIDDTVIERDFTNEAIAPIGAPANDPAYIQVCYGIATVGYSDTANIIEKTPEGKSQYAHIPPSQIKRVFFTIE